MTSKPALNFSELSLRKLKRQPTQKDCSKTAIRNDHLSHLPWYKRINALNCTIVFGLPIIAFYGLFTTHEFVYQTWIWAFIFYLWTGLGITAGYHRLWSHVSYECDWLLETFLMIGGTGALQGSIKWWTLLHRAHHRYTDTDSDPYNAQRGFFYSHLGWLLFDNIRVSEHVDMMDVRRNRIVQWQHKHFPWFGPFMALIFPSLVAYWFWDDLRGGFFIAGALRLLFVQHATWCVNSVAHYFGEHTFDDTISPRDSIITGLITFGEGYHNFHHEFPHDYRNGVHWYDYDPTKWFVFCMARLGLAWNLSTFPDNEIIRGEWEMNLKKIIDQRENIEFGVDVDSLPIWTPTQLKENCQQSKKLFIVFCGIIYDVTRFVAENRHPGGKKIIIERNGEDVTNDMNGLIYNHTNAARNLLSHMRVAKLQTEEED